ncbi:TIM barrel protein [Paenibacillus lemnae]|uniref:Sugar phosphate isomerase/epimerase n=1 Tax=Paenibacillus lemnae TaxID=1330551 RepID=A0A848MBK3_PAELE|nr:sugar phosphate isomerase/epimerase [Paenibacillus lemnae]
MKKGINIWSFKKESTTASCIELASRAGFDGIELSLNTEGELGLQASDKDIYCIQSQLDAAGMEIAGLATGLYWNYSMTCAEPSKRQKAIDICKKQLELASAFGVDAILVIPGAVHVSFIAGSEVVPYDIAYERAAEAIAELVPYAASAGVSIAIENVWNDFLLSPLELRQFIDEQGSDYVGSYFDVGNVVSHGFPEQWISILGSRIKKVHVKDYRRKAGGLHGFVDLLAGDVNYPAVVQALRDIGYDGYLTAEMLPSYTHHTEQLIYNTSAALDVILGRSQQ